MRLGLAIIAVALLLPFAAKAQDRVRSLGNMTQQDRITLPVAPQNPNFQLKNQFLEDTLRLQYQISLLESMIQRQSGIARLEKNYLDLGVSFEQPAPPRGICEQLPANIPCYRAYPELYDIVLPEIQQLDLLIEEPLTIEQVEIPPTELDLPEPEPENILALPTKSVATQYAWAEILCGGGVCSGVVVKNNDSSKRRTVQVGDTLESGSIEVAEISSIGITLRDGEETIKIDPAVAPGLGGPNSRPNLIAENEPPTQSQASREIENILGAIDDSPPAQAEAPAQDASQEIIQDPGPPLGPTGLF